MKTKVSSPLNDRQVKIPQLSHDERGSHNVYSKWPASRATTQGQIVRGLLTIIEVPSFLSRKTSLVILLVGCSS